MIKPFNLPEEATKPNSPLNFIFENAQGIPTQVDVEPTTDSGILPLNGSAAFYNGNLYWNLSGKVYRINLTEV